MNYNIVKEENQMVIDDEMRRRFGGWSDGICWAKKATFYQYFSGRRGYFPHHSPKGDLLHKYRGYVHQT